MGELEFHKQSSSPAVAGLKSDCISDSEFMPSTQHLHHLLDDEHYIDDVTFCTMNFWCILFTYATAIDYSLCHYNAFRILEMALNDLHRIGTESLAIHVQVPSCPFTPPELLCPFPLEPRQAPNH
jgi:hypothetical protein